MCEEPFVTKEEMLSELDQRGIEIPRLYKLGFSHNNCGGMCIRVGQAHFINLLKTMPERFEERFFNDGDHVAFSKFSDLKEFLEDYYGEEIEEDEELVSLINDESERFDELWEYVEDNLNDDGYFDTAFVKEEGFIVPDTMFLTKEEAKRHLELNNYHYTSKVHTYAMTAWRLPKVERLLNILETFDWESISTK